MYARWGSFAVGLGLMAAPALLGYSAIGPILHDVALGLLVCIGTLAALEWPAARFALTLPAAWLAWTGHAAPEPAASGAEFAAGLLLLGLALVPSARHAPRLVPDPRARAGARA
ncbi:MAG: hypothetical protein QM767_25245 [Anaeromyxobacter sp.]